MTLIDEKIKHLKSLFTSTQLYSQYLNRTANDEYMNRINDLRLLAEISRNDPNHKCMYNDFKKELDSVPRKYKNYSENFIKGKLEEIKFYNFVLPFNTDVNNTEEGISYYCECMSFFVHMYDLLNTNESYRKIIDGSNELSLYLTIEHIQRPTYENERILALSNRWSRIEHCLNLIRDGLYESELYDINAEPSYVGLVQNTFDAMFINTFADYHSDIVIYLTDMIYNMIHDGHINETESHKISKIINSFFKFAKDSGFAMSQETEEFENKVIENSIC